MESILAIVNNLLVKVLKGAVLSEAEALFYNTALEFLTIHLKSIQDEEDE